MSIFDRISSATAAGVDAARSAWARANPTAAIETPPATSGEPLTSPAPWQERDPAILGNRLTPGALAGIIARRNAGEFQPWVDLGAEFLSKNPHLLTQLSVRRVSVIETKLEVRPGKGSNQQRARLAAKAYEELLDQWRARQEFESILAQITLAEWWGRSLHELVWERQGSLTVPARAIWVHPRRLSYACPMDDPEPWTIRLHDADDFQSPFGGPFGVPITRWHPDKFVLHETSPLGVQKTGEGLFSACVWYLLMYEWSWRDLLGLIELLGRPGFVGYYNAGGAKADGAVSKFNGGRNASPEELTSLTRAVQHVSGSLRAVLADTTRVEPLQHGQRATPLQLEAIQHIEGLLSKLVNGSTGVTDLVSGARASHQTAYAQSFSYWRYDVRRACAWLNDVGARMVRANPDRFGERCPPPEVWAPETERQSVAEKQGEGAGANDQGTDGENP